MALPGFLENDTDQEYITSVGMTVLFVEGCAGYHGGIVDV